MHTLHCYFKPGAGVLTFNGKISNYQIPVDLYPPSFQLKLFEMLTMHTLSPLTESTIPTGECKQSRDSYVKLIPVQQAQIAKYVLASGNKTAFLLRYTKEFQTETKKEFCWLACEKQNMCQN